MARIYQVKQNIGSTPDSNEINRDGANEYNSVRKETQTAVERAGLTPASANGTGEDTSQLAQSLMIAGAGASSFQAAGTVDAITLTPVTGLNGLKLPPDYSTLHGFRSGFYPTGTSTGNVTISVGQDAGSQFGVKKALNNDGSEIVAGTLTNALYVEFIYDETADASAGAFVLVPYSLALGGGGGGVSPGDPTIAVSPDDTTLGDLETKLVAGTNISFVTLNPGANETRQVNADADTGKVDKNLSSDVDYVPTSVINDTDDFFVGRPGIPSKISGLDLKAVLSPPSSQAKAWVKFNGIGVAVINDSFNVSSVFDLPTPGQYDINFTVNFANADYAAAGISRTSSGGDANFIGYSGVAAPTTSTLQVFTVSDLGANQDLAIASIICFGEQ